LGTFVRNFDRIFPLNDPPDYEPPPSASIAATAARMGISPEELAYDMMLENGCQRMLYCAAANYDGLSLSKHRDVLQRAGVLVGLGDGGAHYGTLCDASYPTFMLTHWVRDRARGETLSLPFVVKALSRAPAELLGFHDRGRLAVGYRADLNVIDFDRLKLGAPYLVNDLPRGGSRLVQKAKGYTATVVGGTVTYRDGMSTGALPGRLVRGLQASP
jgi:N-acyl-D-aspartate/D-glutamate deacylase